MNLTEWMLTNLPAEVVADNTNPALADRLRDALADAWDEGYVNCDETNCANCYSCGSYVVTADNPYRRPPLTHGAPE